MATDLAAFRDAYPELAAAPDTAVTYSLGLASRLLNRVRWGEIYDDGILLLAAHNLALSQAASSAKGSAIGAPGGIVSSKSVGPVSKSYDTSVGLEDGAGLYGATSYGRRYYQLLRMIGAGGVQL